MDLSERLMLLSGLVIGLTFHECAHAWSAWKLGDGYARRQGRVTLNPLRHLDPLGTLAIFLLPFGWARPVPINLYNFRRPRLDYLLSSLAGPAANAVLVGVCLGLMQLTRRSFLLGPGGVGWMTSAHQWLELVLLINVILGLLNLIPLPPLDGSKIWPVLIPSIKPNMGGKLSYVWVIVLVVLLQTGAADGVFYRLFRGVESVTPDTDALRLRQLVDRGKYWRNLRDYPKAMAMFQAALEITDRHPDAWVGLGRTHLQMGRPNEALTAFDRAASLPNAGSEVHFWRGEALMHLDRPAEAVDAYSRAIEEDGRYVLHWQRRADAYEGLGEDELARQDREEARNLRRFLGGPEVPASGPTRRPTSEPATMPVPLTVD